ncbi:DUF1861 family protein [Paenibacillus sp. CF384]|uniref:MTP-1 family protein n=1 Tax=Paenibacillus sp. CF384 TaxID=1884382 RepID=UPI0008996E67|nr:DUF1861 family protein [Paenibacillus sp. CF384]SDX92841.1 Protein of unknown function [Paenibacillus sp. CF384]
MSLNKTAIKTCEELLRAFQSSEASVRDAQKIVFAGAGIDDKDVYNITAPFTDEGEQVIAGRVESRDSEHSDILFFTQQGGSWSPRDGAPSFRLQDPFFTRIAGDLVLGGVEIFPDPMKPDALKWRTVFYRGKNIAALQPFFKGPDGMKDIRLVELADGSIGVFTRPQGAKGGRGKIGYVHIASLDELTVDRINDAPLLDGQFTDDEWGGANEAHLLKNGLVGVLGHIASFDDQGDRHYYPMAFVFDPADGTFSDIELIAVRAAFLPGPSKRPDLQDVVFSGGLVRQGDGTAVLYAGISDADAQRITITDPFARFEHEFA